MYGVTSGMLRDALSELLRQHRIQQRIGGAGVHTVPETTTPDERKVIGEQIARYRYAVLVWSHQAMRAANPHINLEGSTGRTRGPARELRFRLEATLGAIEVDLPTMDELVTEQPFALVDTWRQAARACVLGEHDFANGVGYGRLSEAQCLTVIKDAADVVRAVVSLDRRYANIPGWQALKEPGRLGRAAESCVTWAGYGEPDYTVDLRGWRPEPTLIEGPELPGITGVLQAQQNLLIHLGTFPTPTTFVSCSTPNASSRAKQPADSKPSTRPWRSGGSDVLRATGDSSTRPVTSAGWSGTVDPPPAKAPSPPSAWRSSAETDLPIPRRTVGSSGSARASTTGSATSSSTASPSASTSSASTSPDSTTTTANSSASPGRRSCPSPRPCRPSCSQSCAATCGPHLSNERRRKAQRKAASTSRPRCTTGHHREERALMSRRSDTPSTASSGDKEMPLALVVPLPQDPFLNTEDACGYLGVPKATLLTWRVRRPGYGPRAVKAGGRLKYRLSELDRWLRDHEESFGLSDDNEGADPASEGGRQVRSRSRAIRVRGGALRTAQP